MAHIAWRPELSDQLAQWWLQTCHGRGRVAVLLGDAGIGKSSTLTWLAEHIGSSAHLISCRGGDVGRPMATAAEIAAALPIPDDMESVAAEVDPLRAADALRVGMERSCSTALLVDDIHDADSSSRTALNVALRRAVLGGVFVVVTGRRTSAALTFAEGFDVCEIDGLEPAAASALLHAASATPMAAEVRDRLLEVAGGNPLALTHLPNALSPDELSGAHLLPEDIPLVGGLRTVLTRQLPRTGTAARELLDLTAVCADGS